MVDDGVAQIVYILNGTIYDENSIYFMLTTTDRDSFKYDGDYYYASTIPMWMARISL